MIGFFLMKCFLGLFALGDVGVGADDTNGIALFITYGSSARHYPTWGAIFVQHAMFVNKFGVFPSPKLDRINPKWYFGGMKIKTSITLSNEVLKAIDLYIGEYRSRSEFIETATRNFIAQLARKEAERRDLELINRHSDSLNAEAEDVLNYQVPL